MIYTDVVTRVPAGSLGSAELRHDCPDKLTRMRAAMHGMPLYREKYARLLINGSVMMTDAEFERNTNAEFMRNARGNVLIAGLGIGMILDPILEKCQGVTVVEINQDVIRLVGPSFPEVQIIQSDIKKWSPPEGTVFDTIYFDIWAHFNEDTSREASCLNRKFKKFLAKGGWMKSWCVIANQHRGRR